MKAKHPRTRKAVAVPMKPITNAAPEWLGAEAGAEWDRRTATLERSLTPEEMDALSAYCVEWDRWKRAEEQVQALGSLIKGSNGQPKANPYLSIANKARDRLARLVDRLPMPVVLEEPDGLKTRRQVANTLNVHMQTICKWEREGLPIAKRGRRGVSSLYDLAAVKEWLAARERAAGGPDGPLDPIQEKAARDHWQAELAQQTHRIRQRELLPAADVERAWAAEVAGVRAKLLSLPTTFSDRLHRAGTLEGVPGTERVLRDAVYDVLRQLAGTSEAEPQPGGGRAA